MKDEPDDADRLKPYKVTDYSDGKDAVRAVLREVQQEPEIECQHCGEVPDGTLTIKTDEFERDHRICNKCALAVLRWL